MVFSSVPLYLDPPNWQQHPNQQVLQGGGSGGGNDQNQHLIPPPQIPQHQLGISGGGGGGGSGGTPPIRPNSMAERARLAKIPPPEAPLKCPRCESTNTKFCYFNNYSLSQPRHFCKTCRRYWTRGGALRNVPVGGGCRRNKRSSGKSSSGGGGGGGGGGSSSSKSSLSSPSAMMGGDRIPLHMDLVSTSGVGPNMPGLPSVGGATGMSSFMASLQNIAQLGMGNLGLTFGGGLSAPPLGGFGGPGGGGGGGGSDHHHHHQLDFPHHQLNNNNNNPNSNHHQQQQVQFPNFLGGFEIPGSSAGAGLYTTSSFQNDHHHHQGMDGGDHHHHHQDHDHDEQGDNGQLQKNCSSSMMSQLAPVKTEDGAAQRLNLAKQFMGMSSSSDHNNNATSNQFWGANHGNNNNNNNNHNHNNAGGVNNMWTDLSGLNSSSTSHLL